MPTLAERCAAIELLVLDVDGVLTDGSIVYSGETVETKAFHVRDGGGLRLWSNAGKQAAIITGRNSVMVTRRAAEMGIKHVVQGVTRKLTALEAILAETGLSLEQTAAIGDDVPELGMFRGVGLAVAVADACPEARVAAHHITQQRGGRGAVREVIELMLRCQGKWQGLIEGI